MEWMNISYILAFLAVFVASASQILLKQSAETEHKNIITKFLNWRVILGYGLLFGTTVLNVFAYRGIELKVNTHDRGYRNHLGDSSGGEYLRGASHKENDSFYCDYSHWYHRIFVVGL